MEALSDGVFSVALTILALDLGEKASLEKLEDLSDFLECMGPQLSPFFISFVNISLYWVIHNNEIKDIRRTDRRHLWLNLAFLMFIVLVPFVTKLLTIDLLGGEQPSGVTISALRLAVRLYAAVFIAAGVALQLIWCIAHPTRSGFERAAPDRDYFWRGFKRNMVPLMWYVVAFLLTFFEASWTGKLVVMTSLLMCLFTPLVYSLVLYLTRPRPSLGHSPWRRLSEIRAKKLHARHYRF